MLLLVTAEGSAISIVYTSHSYKEYAFPKGKSPRFIMERVRDHGRRATKLGYRVSSIHHAHAVHRDGETKKLDHLYEQE
jgi:hypothetical protein